MKKIKFESIESDGSTKTIREIEVSDETMAKIKERLNKSKEKREAEAQRIIEDYKSGKFD